MAQWRWCWKLFLWNGVQKGFFEEGPARTTVTLWEADGVAPEVREMFGDS